MDREEKSRGINVVSYLDFKLLFEQWEKLMDRSNPNTCLYHDFIKRIQDYPELQNSPLHREDVYREENKLGFGIILSSLFPLSGQEEDKILALTAPFDYSPIYSTPAFHKEFLDDEGEMNIPMDFYHQKVFRQKMVQIYGLIFDQIYGRKFKDSNPLVFKIPSPEGYSKHFQFQMNLQYVKVVPKGEVPAWNQPSNFCNFGELETDELERWLKEIPLDLFEFHGFSILEAQDLTLAQSVANLNEMVLHQEQVSSDSFMELVEDSVKSLLRKKDLKVGLAVLQTINGRMVMTESRLAYSYLIKQLCGEGCGESYQAVLELLAKVEKPIFLNDLDLAKKEVPLGVKVSEMGIKEIILYPLKHNNDLVGVLEICASESGTFDPSMFNTLDYLAPSLSIALNRQAELLDQKIKGIIRKNFTAIHPVVEWKFDEIALDYVLKGEEGVEPDFQPIVFNEVYPFYAAVDVKNSSIERNKATQEDLQLQLKMGKDILVKAKEYEDLPLLDRLIDQIEEFETRINLLVVGEEEVKIADFFHFELDPTFQHLKEQNEGLRELCEVYQNSLDPKMGIVNKNRKAFEQSLAKLNQIIGTYLDQEETNIQKMFPHYFEKFKTDGIEYNIYIGQSLVKGKKFDPLYLKNLKLWQLRSLISIVHRVSSAKKELAHELDVTQMILAHSTPISISFRLDERKFDVEGAYNIRYEIIKKRIDKALIKGTRKRLNQPGKIAIVYSQTKDAREYQDYIHFLQKQGLLTSELEEVELEDMQGVYGMKALRVTVKEETQSVPDPSKLISEGKEG